MAVDPAKLKVHLADYEKFTGKAASRFVCPILLDEIDDSDLIDGHILNNSFIDASKRTVIQFGRIDHFFGSRVEPALINHLNLLKTDPVTFLAKGQGGKAWIELDDGSKHNVIWADGTSAKHAAGKGFLVLDVTVSGVKVPFIIPKHFPTVPVVKAFYRLESAVPLKWVTGMLKAAYLTMFSLFGYEILKDPMTDTLRRNLAQFYRDKASADDLQKYFGDFHNGFKIIERADPTAGSSRVPVPLGFDTLTDQMYLCYRAPSGSLFAMTCLYTINGATVGITLPQSSSKEDIATNWKLYQRLMADDSNPFFTVHAVHFEGDKWMMSKTPYNYHIAPPLDLPPRGR